MMEFQSTFPRGERHNGNHSRGCSSYFNPRSRVGNDGATFSLTVNRRISIHVPAWGTTNHSSNVFLGSQFQSTFPRGERQFIEWNSCILQYFNPRSRVGNDEPHYGQCCTYHYFNPRSRVGNDGSGIYRIRAYRYFNPRSRVGNDRVSDAQMAAITDFNPRSRVGNDLCQFYDFESESQFQSTFPRGERRFSS